MGEPDAWDVTLTEQVAARHSNEPGLIRRGGREGARRPDPGHRARWSTSRSQALQAWPDQRGVIIRRPAIWAALHQIGSRVGDLDVMAPVEGVVIPGWHELARITCDPRREPNTTTCDDLSARRILGDAESRIAIELDGAIPVPSLALAVTVTQHVEAHIVDREAVRWDDCLAREQVDDFWSR